MGEQSERYYFHGDIVPADETLTMARRAFATWPGKVIVYCSMCDWFEEADQVRAHDTDPVFARTRVVSRKGRLVDELYTNLDRLNEQKARHRKGKEPKVNRPANAPNIFEGT